MLALVHAYIGDLFALDFYLTNEIRDSVTSVAFTPAMLDRTRDLIPYVFPNAESFIVCKQSSSSKKNIYEAASYFQLCKTYPQLAGALELRQWHGFYSTAHPRPAVFSKGSFLTKQIADISKFQLPARFILLHAYSSWSYQANRDMLPLDLMHVHTFAKKHQLPVVLLGQRELKYANSKVKSAVHKNWQPAIDELARLNSWINYIDQTTLFESIEILKKATCFVGASSCLAVLAAAQLPESNVFIKADDNVWKSDMMFNFFYPYATRNIFLSRPVCAQDFNKFNAGS